MPNENISPNKTNLFIIWTRKASVMSAGTDRSSFIRACVLALLAMTYF